MRAKITAVALSAAVVVAALLAFAGPASAHVTVSAPGATSGGSDQIITFRVPTESATASTVEVQVAFPMRTPIATVLVQPHPGWSATAKTVQLSKPIVTDDGDITQAVSEVTWQADSSANGIKPGQFDQFVVIAGLLPKVGSLTFPAIQTYSDGTVVKWIESPAPGSTAAPDHPAPVLTLATGGSAGPSVSSGFLATAPGKTKSSDTGAVVLAVIALVVAVAALGFGFVSRAKAARR